MNTATKIEGAKIPLTSGEVEAFRGAFDDVDGSNELIGRVALETGLGRSEMAHLREDWLIPDPDFSKIRVPSGKEDCQAGRDPPCSHCCQKRDGVWSTHRLSRTVPVFNDETSELLHSLMRKQATLGSVDKIQDSIQWIGERAGIERDEGPIQVKTIKNTFIVKLLDDGFSIDEICRLMGYEQPVKSHQYTAGSPAKIKQLGHYCEGRYPFQCNAETTSRNSEGDYCVKKVIRRDSECIHHGREWARCRALLPDGSPCMNRVSEPDEHCAGHGSTKSVCGEPVGEEVCQNHVVAYEKCAIHRDEDVFNRCGEPLSDGAVCSNWVSESGESCRRHR